MWWTLGCHVPGSCASCAQLGCRRLAIDATAAKDCHGAAPVAGCRSLRELSLADNPQLVVGSAAAQQLAAAVPHLERLRLNMEVHCGGEGGEGGGGGAGAAGGKLRAQMEGLQTLTQLLGNRLVLEP